MCGIAFMINYNKKEKMPLDLVESIFTELKKRGTDSAGIYFERIEGKEVIRRMYKSPLHSDELYGIVQLGNTDVRVSKPVPKEYVLTGREYLIFLHARAKTRGTELDNNNNMPIFSENYALIHNGILSSPVLDGYNYLGKVDSEELLARIELSKSVKEGIQRTAGSMAVVIKHFDEKCIYVYRNSNPLYLIFFKKKRLLIGISDEAYVDTTIQKAVLQRSVFNPIVTIERIPSEILYKISLETGTIDEIEKITKSSQDDAKKEEEEHIKKLAERKNKKIKHPVGSSIDKEDVFDVGYWEEYYGGGIDN